MTLFHESLPGRLPREWEPLLPFPPTPLPGRPTFPTFSHATKLMGLLLLLLSFICSLACLLSWLFLSLFEASLAGEEGTTHPEAFRSGTHARRAGEDEPPASPREAANPPWPPPGPLGARSERVKEPAGAVGGREPPGRAGSGSPGCGLARQGIHRPSARRGGARTGAGLGRGVKRGFLKDAHNAVGLNVR